jgi:hypothetical protein
VPRGQPVNENNRSPPARKVGARASSVYDAVLHSAERFWRIWVCWAAWPLDNPNPPILAGNAIELRMLLYGSNLAALPTGLAG